MKKSLKTIKTLYKTAQTEEASLFPSFSSDWWSQIYTNDTKANLDILFTRLYTNFIFYSSISDIFEDDGVYTDAAALTDFKQAVLTLFMKNDKKYTELYRIHSIPDDEAYALTNNYDLHETYSGTNATQGSAINGQRTDVTIDQTGSQNSSGVNKVTGWDSSSENVRDSNDGTIGSREDTHQFTKGQQQDTNRTQGQDSHTLRRYGNIGVMTIQDMLTKQKDFWIVWDFLQIIFNDICEAFLMIGDDHICW